MSLKGFKSRTIIAGGNAKTVKGDDTYQTAIMYLAPWKASGMGNVCPTAEIAGCIQGCIFVTGRADIFESVNKARIAKTQRYFSDRAAFLAELVRDIGNFVRHCDRIGVKPACRLNGTSDIQWEVGHPCIRNGMLFTSIFTAFPEVVFYDYTKIAKRCHKALPSNYSLTLSYSAANPAYADTVLRTARETGVNVAVVYRSKELRNRLIADGSALLATSGFGFNTLVRPVINGDETDMRFLDPKGCIVGLYAKGRRAKKDTSGFVVG